MTYKVVELFDSIDGEGIRTGQPATFIRLAGCNLRCSYCDTLYALFGEDTPCEYTSMTLEQIMQKVNPVYRRITLTGGEPLIADGVDKLCRRLLEDGYEVNIETNGAVSVHAFRRLMPDTDKLFFTVDYKLPSSGMQSRMLDTNFTLLHPCDVIKFVVGSSDDVTVMLDVMKRITPAYDTMPHIFVGAVYGKYEATDLVNVLLTEPVMKDARFQVQLHKLIWNPDERGV